MDFLNKAYKAILDLFKSMTPAARVTTGLLLVAIVVSTMFLFQGSISSVKTNLFPSLDLRPTDIAKIQQAFSKVGFNDYKINGTQIWVPLSQRAVAWKAVGDAGAMPSGAEDETMSGNFLESSSEQKRRQRDQIGRRIKKQVEDMDAVHQAIVQLDEASQGFARLNTRSCSVTITPQNRAMLTEKTYQTIVNIVQGSYAGISPSNVRVSDTYGVFSTSGAELQSGGGQQRYMLSKKQWDSSWKRKIQDALYNFGDLKVNVDVELTPSEGELSIEREVSTPTVLDSKTKKTTETSRDGSRGGAPGTRSQQPGASANGSAVASSGRSMTKDVSEESSRSDAGARVVQKKTAGLYPTMVRATIGVTRKTVLAAYLQANPPADGEEDKPVDPTKLQETFLNNYKKPIQEKIGNLITSNSQPGKTVQDNVVVVMEPDPVIEPLPGPPITEIIFGWLSTNWQSVGLMCFGIFAIVSLRSMVTSAISETKPGDEAEREFGSILPPPVDPEDQEVVVQRADGSTTVVKRSELEEVAGEDSIEKANKLLDRFQNRQPTLREELTELVEADLDAAASVLKSWIGDP